MSLQKEGQREEESVSYSSILLSSGVLKNVKVDVGPEMNIICSERKVKITQIVI